MDELNMQFSGDIIYVDDVHKEMLVRVKNEGLSESFILMKIDNLPLIFSILSKFYGVYKSDLPYGKTEDRYIGKYIMTFTIHANKLF